MRINILVFFVLFVILLLPSLHFLPAFGATIFSDGFESGNFSAWDGTIGSPTVGTVNVYSGRYSMCQPSAYSPHSSNCCYENVTATSGPLYVRAYVYFTTLPSQVNYENTIISVDLDGNARGEQVYALNNGTTVFFAYQDFYNGKTNTSEVVNVNQWYCVELCYEKSGVGQSAVWINGVLEMTDQANPAQQADCVYVGAHYSSWGGIAYFDDVVIATSYIGPQIEVPPSISVLSPGNTTYAASDIALTFTVNETASWMAYSLDGQGNVTIAGNVTLTGLFDGSHSVTVFANDTYGNMGSSEPVYFTVESAPAKVNTQILFSFSPNPALPGQTVTLSGTLKDVSSNPVYPASVTVYYSTNGGSTWTLAWTLSTNSAGAFSHSFTAPAAGSYLIRVSYAGSSSYNPSSNTATLTIS